MGAAYGRRVSVAAISVAVAVGARRAPPGEALIRGSRSQIDPVANPGGTWGRSSPATLERFQLRRPGVKEGPVVVDGRGLQVPGAEVFVFFSSRLPSITSCGIRFYQEEIFGPGWPWVAFARTTHPVGHAHRYGNGGAIFTGSGEAADEFTKRIQIGMVGVNVPIPVPMAFHSFGGWKGSLFGDHYMHGPEGVRFFTRMKTVTSRWPKGQSAGASFAMPTVK